MAVHTAEAGGIAKLSFENPLWAPRPASRKRGASPPGCRPPGPQSSPSRCGPVAYAHGPADAAAAPCLARGGVSMPCRHWMQQIFQRPEYPPPGGRPLSRRGCPLASDARSRCRAAALLLEWTPGFCGCYSSLQGRRGDGGGEAIRKPQSFCWERQTESDAGGFLESSRTPRKELSPS